MMMAARDEEKGQARQTALLATYIVNHAGFGQKKAVQPHELFPDLFEKAAPGGAMSDAEMREMERRHLERLAHERTIKGQA